MTKFTPTHQLHPDRDDAHPVVLDRFVQGWEGERASDGDNATWVGICRVCGCYAFATAADGEWVHGHVTTHLYSSEPRWVLTPRAGELVPIDSADIGGDEQQGDEQVRFCTGECGCARPGQFSEVEDYEPATLYSPATGGSTWTCNHCGHDPVVMVDPG